MNKFLSFLYKFSSVIMMIIGVLVSIFLIAITAIYLSTSKDGVTGWSDPSVLENGIWTVVVFSISTAGLGLSIIFGFLSIFFKSAKWLSKFGRFIIMTIAFVILLLAAIYSGQNLSSKPNGWTEFNDGWAKARISIFSISVILISMNFVFGILTANYRRKLRKQANNANNQANI
ncbi:MAG: hypothetical protein K2L64_02335 [Ureaplasma sp.]|nr:hypothetical protein [Ureaplasma sp.]